MSYAASVGDAEHPDLAAGPSTLPECSPLLGRYHLEELVGSGGMCTVHAAWHADLARRVAIKRLKPDLRSDPTLRRKFQQEGRLLALLHQVAPENPHLTRVYDGDLSDDADDPYIVMEFLNGRSLTALVHERGPQSLASTLRWIRQIALGLRTAHEHTVEGIPTPIVHCDVKPDNLFVLQGQGLIKVVDFGVAKLVEQSGISTSGPMGTPTYMAPEQYFNLAPVSPATDVYAFALVAFFLLAGEHYWNQQGNALRRARQSTQKPASDRAAEARKDLTFPEEFDAWFARCTRDLPSERPASAAEAAAELEMACRSATLTQLRRSQRRAAREFLGPSSGAGAIQADEPTTQMPSAPIHPRAQRLRADAAASREGWSLGTIGIAVAAGLATIGTTGAMIAQQEAIRIAPSIGPVPATPQAQLKALPLLPGPDSNLPFPTAHEAHETQPHTERPQAHVGRAERHRSRARPKGPTKRSFTLTKQVPVSPSRPDAATHTTTVQKKSPARGRQVSAPPPRSAPAATAPQREADVEQGVDLLSQPPSSFLGRGAMTRPPSSWHRPPPTRLP